MEPEFKLCKFCKRKFTRTTGNSNQTWVIKKFCCKAHQKQSKVDKQTKKRRVTIAIKRKNKTLDGIGTRNLQSFLCGDIL